MVDFNNEATIGTPRGEILSVLILQRRNDVIDAIEFYNNAMYQGAEPPIHIVRKRLVSLFFEIRAPLKNSVSEKAFLELCKQVASNNMDDIENAFKVIDEWLYRKNITKIDTRKDVDTDDIEEVNKSHGM